MFGELIKEITALREELTKLRAVRGHVGSNNCQNQGAKNVQSPNTQNNHGQKKGQTGHCSGKAIQTVEETQGKPRANK